MGITSKHRGITRFRMGITRFHTGITRLHRGITIIQISAARRRWRRIVDPVHAALVKGLGDNIHMHTYIHRHADRHRHTYIYKTNGLKRYKRAKEETTLNNI